MQKDGTSEPVRSWSPTYKSSAFGSTADQEIVLWECEWECEESSR
jgi:hypothetical protein